MKSEGRSNFKAPPETVVVVTIYIIYTLKLELNAPQPRGQGRPVVPTEVTQVPRNELRKVHGACGSVGQRWKSFMLHWLSALAQASDFCEDFQLLWRLCRCRRARARTTFAGKRLLLPVQHVALASNL